MTRQDADRDAAKRAKQDFQIACQLLQIKKHHVSFQGHGPPHKRAYSCHLKAQMPSSWIELGFVSGTLEDIAAAANAAAPGAAATAEGVGKDSGQRVLEVHGGAIDFNKNDAQRLAILDLFDALRVATNGAIDPRAPPNVGKLAKERARAARKTLADEGRLMLELVHSSRPHVEYTSTKNGWGAVVRAFVDGGKRVEAEGFGDAKGDAEDAAYGAVSDALRRRRRRRETRDASRGSRSVPRGVRRDASYSTPPGRRDGRAHQRHGNARGSRRAHARVEDGGGARDGDKRRGGGRLGARIRGRRVPPT